MSDINAFVWKKPVPQAWQDDLNQLNPGETVTSLQLIWQAGWPWRPVQRWEIYEVTPVSAVQKILMDEKIMGIQDSLIGHLWAACRGPNPRTIGEWKRDRTIPLSMGGKKWRSASVVSEAQWLLHRQTGGLPMRSWIIEGDHGGHAWQFGKFEQAFLLASGIEPEVIEQLVTAWPNPGSAPYADYDQRVFRALAERNQLHHWRQSVRWSDRMDRQRAGDLLEAESATRHKEMLARMFKWIEHQVGGMVSDIPRSQLPAWSDFRAVEKQEDQDVVLESLMEE